MVNLGQIYRSIEALARQLGKISSNRNCLGMRDFKLPMTIRFMAAELYGKKTARAEWTGPYGLHLILLIMISFVQGFRSSPRLILKMRSQLGIRNVPCSKFTPTHSNFHFSYLFDSSVGYYFNWIFPSCGFVAGVS